jgi:hypothetical protein
MAMLQTQMMKALPSEPQTQIPFYLGKYKEKLDVEKAAEHLSKYLKSCTEEMKLVCYALGKTDLAQLNRNDLVTVDRELSEVLGIDYAGFPPSKQAPHQNLQENPWIPPDFKEQQNSPDLFH